MKTTLKQLLIESGYARVINIMRGLVPTVNTIAFLTAENPKGVPADSAFNKKANSELEKRLRSMNLGFNKVKGQYGGPENSFFIPNITKEEALELGKVYDQESIIFGEKAAQSKDGKSYDGMTFSLIYTDNRFGKVEAQQDVFVNMDNAEDYFTKVKGRKFQIPFFDDDYITAKFKPSSGVLTKETLSQSRVVVIQSHADYLLETNRTGKSKWINRGHLLKLLKESV